MTTAAESMTSTGEGPQNFNDLISQNFWQQQAEELLATAHVIALKILYALIVLLVGWIIIKIVMWIIRKIMTRVKWNETVKNFALAILNFFLWMILWLQIFKILSIPNTSFTAVMAALAFALGLALSGALNNVLSGLIILSFEPFKVGDFVSGGGVDGVVSDIFLTYTIIRTGDNKRCLVPNMPLATETLVNWTKNETRRVDLTIGIAHEADPAQTRKLLTKAVRSHNLVLKDPPITVEMFSLDPSCTTWIVRPWCKTADVWTVLTEVTTKIKEMCDEAGIGISFPQKDVHVFRQALAVKEGLGDDVDDNDDAPVKKDSSAVTAIAGAVVDEAKKKDSAVATAAAAVVEEAKEEKKAKESKKKK